MKKIFIAAAAALTTIVACQKYELAAPAADSVLYATIEETDATKTYMDANNNIRWSEGDQVVGFMKSSLGLKYQILPSSVGKTSASFENVSGSNGNINAGTEWDHNVVYYPYSDAVEAAKSGSDYTLDVVLPSEQTYVSESFGNGSMAMVAVSENNNITFRNVLGGMKLQLKGTQKVKSITLQGNNNEKLSGAAVVTAYAGETKPAITMAQSASTSVTLDCGSGVQLSESKATEFIIALPPVVFTKGFTVTVTDTESNTYTVGTDKENEVLRSSLLVMPAVSLGSGQGSEPQEGDYIDEYGINHGPGVEIDGVVWAPVNCGYHKTDYQYGKLYQWGREYGQGYSGYDNNTSSNVSDATVPEIRNGGVSLPAGQSEDNANVFFLGYPENDLDWVYPSDGTLWNSGTESEPVKTEYDPCPDGWRVPTYAELEELIKNKSSWTTNDKNQVGYWFSGQSSYTLSVPQVFFPAAGFRYDYNGYAYSRGFNGNYWSSRPESGHAYSLYFYNGYTFMSSDNRSYGFSVRCVQDDATLIPVENITLSKSSLTLSPGTSETLSSAITPSNANHRSAHWWSENPEVASVDQNGNVTAVSAGTTTIYAMAGMQVATCEVTVTAGPQEVDYIDEYGINHGQGVKIGETVWAPVNCGYHETDFKYGKLYQWGRKYGQGYSGELYDIYDNIIGDYSDATVTMIMSGPVSLATGQSKNNEKYYYTTTLTSYPYDWLSPQKDELWNSGDEDNPVKTEYDPCPDGWRVPTSAELNELCQNHSSWTSEEGQPGYWFSGSSTYTDKVSQVFFPAAGGYRHYKDNGGYPCYRGRNGYYWSSRPNSYYAYCLSFLCGSADLSGSYRAFGNSVRCVQD